MRIAALLLALLKLLALRPFPIPRRRPFPFPRSLLTSLSSLLPHRLPPGSLPRATSSRRLQRAFPEPVEGGPSSTQHPRPYQPPRPPMRLERTALNSPPRPAKNPPKLSLAGPTPFGGRPGQRQFPPSPPTDSHPHPAAAPSPATSGRGNEGGPVDWVRGGWVSGGCLVRACGGGWPGGPGGRVLRGRRGGRGGRGGGRRGHPDSGCCAGGCTASCHR